MYCRVVLPTNEMKKYIKHETEFNESKINNLMSDCENDYYKILLQLELNTNVNELCPNNLIEKEITELILYMKRAKLLHNILNKIRDCIYKILHYSISHPEICKIILKICVKKYKSKTHNIIHMISILEHTLLDCSKPLYYYEKFFLELYELCNCNTL